MQLEKKLFDHLIESLDRVPITNQRDGRDSLLIGIPTDGWTRSDNKNADLKNIVLQVSDIFIGENESIENWGLLYFIDDAHKQVNTTSLGKQLKDLRTECVQAWEKEHTAKHSTIQIKQEHKDTRQVNRHTPVLLTSNRDNLEDADVNQDMGIDHNETILCKEEIFEESSETLFFAKALLAITTIQQSISQAAQPFKDQHISQVSPAEYMHSSNALKKVLKDIQNCIAFINTSDLLPTNIKEQQNTLTEQGQFLSEQIYDVNTRIEKHGAPDTQITAKFATIEKEIMLLKQIIQHCKEAKDSW